MAEGISGFLTSQTAGLPNWAWIGVVAAGIGAAYLFPKFLGGAAPGAGATTDQTGGQGIGLAVDPTTGLPYAVEGLVPSGAGAGGGTISTPLPPSAPPPIVTQPLPSPAPAPAPAPKPPQVGQRFVTAQRWPNILGSLSGIASQSGISLARIEQLNPQIKNPNLIYPGQQIRVA